MNPYRTLGTCLANSWLRLLLLVTLALIPGRANAAVILDQIAYMGGSSDFVVMSNNIAFVTVGDELNVIDTTNPADPALVGSCSLLGANATTVGEVVALDLSGSSLFVLRDNGSVAFQVVDVSVPSAPALVGSYSPPASAEMSITGRSMSVETSLVFLGISSFGVLVVDATDPSAPVLRDSYDISPAPGVTTPTVQDVSAVGSRVFIKADVPDAIFSVDFSSPGAPVLLGGSSTTNGQRKILASSDHVYLFNNSIQIFDADFPATLPLLGTATASSQSFVVSGTTAYSTNSLNFEAIDLTNPANPAVLGSLTVDGLNQVSKGDSALASGRTVLATGSELSILDVSTLATPALAGGFSAHYVGEPIQAPLFSNGRMYMVTDTSDFNGPGTTEIAAFLTMTNSPPVLLGSLELAAGNFPNDVAVSGDILYVVTDNALIAIDATVPQSMAFLGTATPPGAGEFGDAVAVSGTTVYAGGADGVNIYNALNPAAIVTVGQYVGDFPNIVSVSDVKVSGTRLYCAAGLDGVQILNVTAPAVPLLLSVGNVGGANIQEIQLAGSRCYARSSNEIITLSVTDPTVPTILGELPLPSTSSLEECPSCEESFNDTFTIVGTAGYVAGGADGLLVVDFSDVTDPQIDDSWDTTWLNFLALDSSLLYLAEDALEIDNPGEVGLRIVTPPEVIGGNTPVVGSITASPFFPIDNERLTLTAPEGGTAYQWRKNGVDMVDDARITGTQSRSLVFTPVFESDESTYTCAFDDGSKQAVETPPYSLVVYPVGSVPASNGWTLTFGAAALIGLGLAALAINRRNAANRA